MYIDNYSSYLAAANRTSQVQSANFNVSGSYLEITGGTSYAGAKSTDQVDVSSQAQELLERIRSLDVFSIIYPNRDATKATKSLDQVNSDFMGDFNNFANTFGTMSAMMGLDSSQTYTMGLDGVGGMTVEGSDSAAAAKLQAGFNGNSTLVARFAVMAARAALVDAGNTVDGFSGAYAQDPVGAITSNIDALKERLLGFRTQASGGQMNYGFMRDFNLDINYTTAANYGAAAVEE